MMMRTMRTMCNMRPALACTIVLAACGPSLPQVSPAAPVEATDSGPNGIVRLRAEPSTVEVGTPITLTLDLLRTDGATTLPTMPIEFGGFDVTPLDPPQIIDGRVVARYRLTTFESGEHTLPPITLRLGEADDAPTITTPSLALTVTSLIGADDDPQKFKDIKARLDLVPQAARWPWYAGGGAAAIALAFAAWLLLARRTTTKRALSADAMALAAIDALERDALPASGQVHLFYVRLADIVRGYVETRFGIRAPELTTPEFLREARRSAAIAGGHQEQLAGFLRGADMVKFAGVKPDGGECAASLALARRFVNESRPVAKEGES